MSIGVKLVCPVQPAILRNDSAGYVGDGDERADSSFPAGLLALLTPSVSTPAAASVPAVSYKWTYGTLALLVGGAS